MTQKNEDNKGSPKLSKKTIWLLIVLPVFLIVFLVGVVIFLVFKFSPLAIGRINKTPQGIAIHKNEDVFELKDKWFDTNHDELKKYKKEDWLAEERYEIDEKNGIITYKDPINNVVFKDYSYGTHKKKKRYFLGKEGLALLAHEFYEKVTFGPEIVNLEEIRVNDFSIMVEEVSGFYIPNLNIINLNGAHLAEKGFGVRQKVIALMSTLFHEYTHHWAATYVMYSSKDEEKIRKAAETKSNKTSIFYYKTDENSERPEYWNRAFVKNYFTNLHYDFLGYKWCDKEKEPINSVAKFLRLADLFYYSNMSWNDDVVNKLGTFLHITKNPITNQITFKSNNEWNEFANITYAFDPDHIPYYYSMAELVPREWQKYTYVPYYVQGVGSENWDSEEVQSLIYKGELPYETEDYTPQGFKISQNYYGEIIEDKERQSIHFATFPLDWVKTVENGSLYKTDRNDLKAKKTFKLNTSADSYTYPNSVWGLEYDYFDWNEYSKESKLIKRTKVFEDTHKEFYKGFLDSMFYGKPFAGIKSWIDFDEIISTDKEFSYKLNPEKLCYFRIFGYLEDEYDYLVFKNTDGEYEKIKISPINFFNYDGKDRFDAGTRELKPSHFYPGKYWAYYTDEYFDSRKINDDSNIFFWKDKNSDGIIDSNEKLENFADDSIPDYRYLVSSDYAYYGKEDGFETTKQLKIIDGKAHLIEGFI